MLPAKSVRLSSTKTVKCVKSQSARELECCVYLPSDHAVSHECTLEQMTAVHTKHKQLMITVRALATQRVCSRVLNNI